MVANAEISKEHNEIVDFICDSPITWTMLEADMQKALKTTAKFGESKKAELIGQGNGFVSKIVVATLDWDQNSEELPESVVLKITVLAQLQELMDKLIDGGPEAQERIAANTIRIHNNELGFYRLVNEDWKVNHNDIKVPVFYCGREWGVEGVNGGYFVVEHVKDAVLRHMYHTVQSPGVIEALEAIAKIHAISLKHPDSIKQFSTEFLMEIFADMYNQDKMRENLPKVAELVPDCQEHIDIMLEKVHVFTLEGYQKIIRETCQPPVLCHGDMWTANMLWTENEDGSERLRALIDWQIVHKGSPVEDFTRFLGVATSRDTKKRDLYLYFDKYYDAFVKECGDDVKPPFTKEELIENYEKFIPFVTVPFAGFFLPMIDIVLASAPDKDEARAVFLDKMRGMLEEAAEYIKKWY